MKPSSQTLSIRYPRPEDFTNIKMQRGQAYMGDLLSANVDRAMRRCDTTARTVTLDGQPIVIAGILYTGEAWMILSEQAGPHLRGIVKRVRAAMDWHSRVIGPVWARPSRLIPNAERWMWALGYARTENNIWIYEWGV